MGKNKAKKGDGSSTRMVTTVAVTGGVFLLRKLLGTAWTRVTGKVPPTDLTDPKVTLVEALAWSVATGIVVETALDDAQVAHRHGSRVKLSVRRSAAGQARQPAGWAGIR
jgi:hypothetical protein